ncbi:MAG: biopolymer transporter ExbD [Epsilonproteobacteria bacterium]|nr:biopolymer transporter ExbD [Campylobacterota bacterium]
MNIDWDEKPDLNITPLVDIMLVLLAILMVTTPAIIYEENIKLPQGSKSKSLGKIPDLEIRITKDKKIFIKKNQYQYNAFADSFILFSKSIPKNTVVYIRADKGLQYGAVMYILKTVKEAGFSKVSLVTEG